MATIDETIYVALPDAVGLAPKKVRFAELHQALFDEAAKATSITVLGGYMSPNYVKALSARVPRRGNGGRSAFPLRIAIGIDPTRPLAQQWEELRRLKTDLRADGFSSVEVKAVLYRAIHFHTKLFGFARANQASWYVGSANPSGTKRHEMMVRVEQSHEAVAAYAEAVLERAIDVSRPSKAEGVRTLRAFFRSGFLAHKLPASNLFTFEAFHFTADERSRLNTGAGVRLGVRYASPTTEGYGFNLSLALANGTAKRVREKKIKRIRHKNSSVETVFGLWVPSPYALELQRAYGEEEKAREQQLARFAATLTSKQGLANVQEALEAYLKDMKRLLKSRGMTKPLEQGYEQRFKRFLLARTNTNRPNQ